MAIVSPARSGVRPGEAPVIPGELKIELLDGCARLTFLRPTSGEVAGTFLLLPDTIAFLVDALCGSAPAASGEARIVVRVQASALADALVRYAKANEPPAPGDEAARDFARRFDYPFDYGLGTPGERKAP